MENTEPRRSTTTSLAARRAAAKKRHILAFTPRGLEPLADKCIRDGLSIEDARKRLLEANKSANDLSARDLVEALGGVHTGINAKRTSDLSDVSDRELVNALSG